MNDRYAAIWIDHAQAQIVQMENGQRHSVRTIESFAEPRHRTTGQTGVPLPGHLGCNTESHDRNRRAGELNRFYDQVIEAIPEGAELVVMGPGFAKRDFLKRLRLDPELDSRILRVQTSSKLSVNQIVAELRKVTRRTAAPGF